MAFKTIRTRKQELYDATTKARNRLHAIRKDIEKEAYEKNPKIEWYDVIDVVEKDPRYIEAVNYLYGLCDACSFMGVEQGE